MCGAFLDQLCSGLTKYISIGAQGVTRIISRGFRRGGTVILYNSGLCPCLIRALPFEIFAYSNTPKLPKAFIATI